MQVLLSPDESVICPLASQSPPKDATYPGSTVSEIVYVPLSTCFGTPEDTAVVISSFLMNRGKSAACFVPPLSLMTCFTTVSVAVVDVLIHEKLSLLCACTMRSLTSIVALSVSNIGSNPPPSQKML